MYLPEKNNLVSLLIFLYQYLYKIKTNNYEIHKYFLSYWNLKDININMTLKFFLRIRIDSNQIELNANSNQIKSNPVFLSSNQIELKLERIELNRITLKFDLIRFVRNLNNSISPFASKLWFFYEIINLDNNYVYYLLYNSKINWRLKTQLITCLGLKSSDTKYLNFI